MELCDLPFYPIRSSTAMNSLSIETGRRVLGADLNYLALMALLNFAHQEAKGKGAFSTYNLKRMPQV